MRKILILALFLLFPSSGFSQGLENYLILNDIGEYKYRPKRTTEIYGNSGILISTGHFDRDHDDITYRTRYVHPVTILGVGVEVTQHAGADSDRWLLHELERDFRTYYGLPDDSFVARQIENDTVIGLSVAGWTYRWASGNKIIQIQYHDSQMTKPEPLEIVKAYLAKHPSTLSPMTSADLRATDNKTRWIKDEMERRLWLCEKWFLHLQMGKAEQQETLQSAVKNMFIFLDYREKYYGVKARDEKILLDNYLINNDGTSIKAKLTEYKTWWKVNKTKSINLP